ncbi:MAG: M15 family metallopeptidase [Bacteroidales bacterium]|nr:M15 family metallopeptidase [Bacteroidales bacterium]
MAVLFFLACGGRGEDAIAEVALCDTDFVTLHCERVRYTATEQRLLALGLVDVQSLDPTIRVHLVYSTEDNFLGRVLYTDIHRALLHPTMATKVVAAQQALHRERPDLDLLILDAARPLSVQYQMFHVVAGTPQNRYVANPKKGPGMHNYGAAVDVTLVDHEGNWLPMGSDFDHFGPESHIDNEAHLLATGKITQEEYDNRRLLRRIMRQQGLLPLASEWWHFNLMTTAQARRTLRAIE